MPVSEDTQPMRRLPDSPPRISRRLRFPILVFLAIDLGLAALAAVVYLTPLNPNIPTGKPMRSDNTPAVVQTIVLPSASPPPIAVQAPYSAPVRPVQTTAVHRVAPPARKTAAPLRTAAPPTPAPAVSRTASATPRVTASTRPPQPTAEPSPSDS